MNQNKHTISLYDVIGNPFPWGVEAGKAAYEKLVDIVERHLSTDIFIISFKNIDFFDASFAREAIVLLACKYRTKKGFCLTDIDNTHLLDNLYGPAVKFKQPLFLLRASGAEFLENPEAVPSKGNQGILDFVYQQPHTTATQAAEALNLKVNNASTKLKSLYEQGFILRKEVTAPTGGIEFIYFPIK